MSNLNAADSNPPPPRRLSLSEKIAEKFSMKGRRNSDQSQQSHQSQESQASHHKYGTRESAHDSAFIVEGSIVGAHAIPPISLAHRYRSQGKTQQPYHGQGQAQAQPHSQATTQIYGDKQQNSGSSHSNNDHH
jgi:hypothetical protein